MDSKRKWYSRIGLFVLWASLLAPGALYAQSRTVIYVIFNTSSGSMTGDSWANAYPRLEDAFDRAHNNTGTDFDIWVSGNFRIYGSTSSGSTANIRRTASDLRSTALRFTDNMRIYGGFTGTETTLNARPANAKSDISGVIAMGARPNAYNIFVIEDDTTGVVIDGFELHHADADHATETNYRRGAGILALEDVTIRNVIVRDCEAAGNGGGIYMTGGTLDDSEIYDNTATTGNGGGIYVAEDATLSDLEVYDNTATTGNGGGVYLAAASATLQDSQIGKSGEGNTTPAGDGGGIYMVGNSTLDDLDVGYNAAGTEVSSGVSGVSGDGGGVWMDHGVIEDSEVHNNSASHAGGGIMADAQTSTSAQPVIARCRIYANEADWGTTDNNHGYGGGVYLAGEAASGGALNDHNYRYGMLANCAIYDNAASKAGGGVYLHHYTKMINCTLHANKGISGRSDLAGQSLFVEWAGTYSSYGKPTADDPWVELYNNLIFGERYSYSYANSGRQWSVANDLSGIEKSTNNNRRLSAGAETNNRIPVGVTADASNWNWTFYEGLKNILDNNGNSKGIGNPSSNAHATGRLFGHLYSSAPTTGFVNDAGFPLFTDPSNTMTYLRPDRNFTGGTIPGDCRYGSAGLRCEGPAPAPIDTPGDGVCGAECTSNYRRNHVINAGGRYQSEFDNGSTKGPVDRQAYAYFDCSGSEYPPTSGPDMANPTIGAYQGNSAPENLAWNWGNLRTVPEDTTAGARLALFTATDADGDPLTYTVRAVEDGSGAVSPHPFSIDSDDSLRINAGEMLNFEAVNGGIYTITVRVSDGNGGFMESDFRVQVEDRNDAPTALAHTPASLSLNENTATGTKVADLTLTDEDGATNGTRTYTVVGSAADTFRISGSGLTPDLEVGANSPDYENRPIYRIRVRVTDVYQGVTYTFERTISITINNLNEAPTSISPTSVTVDEGSTGNLATIVGSDPEGHTLTYSLVTSGSPFSLSSGGVLSLNSGQVLDHETTASYSLTVRVSDNATLSPANQSADFTFTLTVRDVNERPSTPSWNITGVNRYVSEDTLSTARLALFTATDPDAGQNVNFRIKASTPTGAPFAFDNSTDSLYISGTLDYETQTSYVLEVEAYDDQSPSLVSASTFDVTIHILDANEPPGTPTWNITGVRRYVSEDTTSSTDTTIDLALFTATDPDAGQNVNFRIKSSTPTGAPFAFDNTNDSLYINGTLDYETQASWVLQVEAYDDQSPSLVSASTFDVTIHILDANDAPTDMALSPASVNENASANTRVGALSVTDEDASGTRTYRITGPYTGTSDTFKIVGGELQVNTISPDYEVHTSHEVDVEVTDTYLGTSITYSKTFTVTINNVNEPPVLTWNHDNSTRAHSVSESESVGFNVANFTARDPEGQTVTLAAVITSTPTPTNPDFTFTGAAAANPGTATLTIARTLDANTAPTQYTVTVTATSASGGSDATTLAYTINVSDVNDAPTNVRWSKTSSTHFYVSEDTTASSPTRRINLVQFLADDPEGDNVTYTIKTSTPTGAPFAIGATSDSLYVNGALDYETQVTYDLEIEAEDHGSPRLKAASTFNVTIHLLDANDEPTDLTPTTHSAAENLALGSSINTLDLDDDDWDSSPSKGTFTYTVLPTSAQDTFEVVESSGTISLRVKTSGRGLDYEHRTKHNIRVRVRDVYLGVTHTFIKDMVVNVTGVNERPSTPSWNITGVRRYVSEDTTSTDATIDLALFTATDPEGDNVNFRVKSSTPTGAPFAFDNTNDSLYINGTLDYETQASWVLEVEAYDDQSPSLVSASTFDVTIHILDANDAPTDLTPASHTAVENLSLGSDISTLDLDDEDWDNGYKGTRTYTILPSTARDTFDVVESGTTISLKVKTGGEGLNYEHRQKHNIRVRVSDSYKGKVYELIKAMTVTVSDANDAPTGISPNPVSVNENSTGNLQTLTASDPDASQTHTFVLAATSAVFDLSSAGVLSLKTGQSLDYETTTSYTLSVKVTDNGSPAQDATFTLTVSIVNVDEAPVLTWNHTGTSKDVSESEPVGFNVANFTGTDPEGANVTLSATITPTSTPAEFTFTAAAAANPGTAALTLRNLLDADAAPTQYTVQVTATPSTGNPTATQSYTINVTDTNDKPHTVGWNLTGTSFTVSEDTAVNSKLALFTATDPEGADVTFTIEEAQDENGNVVATHPFDIYTSGGPADSLYVKSALDYETSSSYTLKVRASDLVRQADNTFDVTIHLRDVNEAPTDIALSSTSVNENAPENTEVGDLSVTDEDASGTRTYAIVGPYTGTSDTFKIVGDELQVNTISPDYEVHTSHEVEIEVTDVYLSRTVKFRKILTVTINQINEAPVLTWNRNNTTRRHSVSETTSTGSNLATFTATDPEGETTTLSIDTSTPLHADLSFTPATGILSLVNALDADNPPTSYTFKVVATPTSGPTTTLEYRINVTNVNDVPTNLDWNLSGTSTDVDENTALSTLIATFSADDAEGDPLTFTIESATPSTHPFTLASTGALTLTTALNHESEDDYVLTIKVADGNGGELTGDFTINVSDVNESPTDLTPSTHSVAEDLSLGSDIATLTLSDEDASGTYTYTVLPTSAQDTFIVDASGSTIKLKLKATGKGLDYEHRSRHAIQVQVRDVYLSVTHTFTKSMVVSVSNVNELPEDLQWDLAGNETTLDETTALSTLIATFSATDPEGKSITYTITAPSTHPFTLDASSGAMTLTTALDYETTSSYALTVTATDADGGASTVDYTVRVRDVNEPPEGLAWNLTGNETTLAEDLSTGTTIATYSATDQEGTTLTYTITAPDTHPFALNGTSGVLTLNSALDYETTTSYTLTVRATDGGGATAEVTYTIRVSDVNEPPEDLQWDLAGTSTTLPENTALSTLIATFSATDPENTTITYAITAPSTHPFTLNASSGAMTLTTALDYETTTSYALTVRATDAGGVTSDVNYTINVSDTNEPPEGLAWNLTGNETTLAEDLSTGTTIATYSATDPESAALTYTITAPATHPFTLDASSGVLTLTTTLNYEANQSYSLTVRVTDAGGETADITYTIRVSDANDAPTALSLTPLVVAENSPTDTPVGAFTITDEDATGNYTYTLIATGTPPVTDTFKIVGNELRVAGTSPDYEVHTHHRLQIQVTDQHLGKSHTFEETFTMEVQSVNEAPTDIILSPTTLEVNENAPAGTIVGTISVEDPNRGDTHTLVLVPAESDTFRIVGNELRIGNISPNYEVLSYHRIRIRAQDKKGLVYEKAFRVNIVDINEPPRSLRLSYNRIEENIRPNTVVGILTTYDEEINDRHIFELVNPTDTFRIVGRDLQVGYVVPDYEVRTYHNLAIRVTDGGGNSLVRHMIVYIMDKLEPYLLQINESPSAYLRLYPNPASKQLRVQSGVQLHELLLLDADGTKLHSQRLEEVHSCEVDVSLLPSGLYFIQGVYGDNKRLNVRFVKE